MALMVGRLYDALKSVNVEDGKARRAAEDVADFQQHHNELKMELTALKGDVALVKWMLGFVLAFNVAILFKVFSP